MRDANVFNSLVVRKDKKKPTQMQNKSAKEFNTKKYQY